MRGRVLKIALKAQVSHRHEANSSLVEPGSTVIVHRGVARSIAMACPDGCGDQLTINLDDRAGPAWRYYLTDSELSLFPSVWRDSGCMGHFIVWRSKIYWCDLDDELEAPVDEIMKSTRGVLTDEFISYVAIANKLGLVPWAVLSACYRLRRLGLAESGAGQQQSYFRRKRAL